MLQFVVFGNSHPDYNAFRGGLKSALRRTFLTTEDTKGGTKATKLKPGAQSLNLHVFGRICLRAGAEPPLNPL